MSRVLVVTEARFLQEGDRVAGTLEQTWADEEEVVWVVAGTKKGYVSIAFSNGVVMHNVPSRDEFKVVAPKAR